MGQWTITIRGCGPHHNGKPFDVEALTKEFVVALKSQSHSVQSADVCTGSAIAVYRDDATAFAKMEELQGNIAGEIRQMLGESAIEAKHLGPEQCARRIEAMKKCAAESTSDEERHLSWMKMHEELGWVYGEKYDAEKKTHPNMLPWDQLPKEVKHKAKIFDLCAKAATAFVAMCLLLILVAPVDASNCHQFFHHQQAIVAPVIAQPVVLYQAGRDVELDALADRVAQRIEQRLQLRQQPLTQPSQPLTQANVSSSVMVQHCAKCHSGATPKAGIVYDGQTNLTGDQIVEALKSVLDGSMPKDHKLPDESKGPLMEELLKLQRKEGGS